MSEEKNPKNEELEALKSKFLEDRKHAQEEPEPEISEIGLQRMNGPIGVELSESEWESIKANAVKSNVLKPKDK